MLFYLTSPSEGDALVDGYSITKKPQEVEHLLGVSPLETAVAPNLSTKENSDLICVIYYRTPQEGNCH